MTDEERRSAAVNLARRALSEVPQEWVAEVLALPGQESDVDVQSVTSLIHEATVLLPVFPDQRDDADPDAA